MKKPDNKKAAVSAVLMGALLLLGSCNFADVIPGEEQSPATPTPPTPVAAATPYTGPGAGEYFNAGEGISLRLDGAGGFVLSTAGGKLEGTYSAMEEELLFSAGGEEIYGESRSDGLLLAGVSGLFSPLEHKSGFSQLGVGRVCDREYSEEPDGGYTLCDYGLGLGLSYPAEMSAPEMLLADAVVVWDGAQGYVTGRNVTEEFFGEGEDFMEDYMRLRVLPDFRILYGEEGSFERMELLDEGVSGRIASAEGLITGAQARIYVKCIMYTSTYADGTVNYICKCFFAPEGDERAFNALANSVLNMTAVRRK